MRKFVTLLAAATLFLVASTAFAGPQQVLLPGDAFCTFNPGINRSTVVCDYSIDFVPRRDKNLRVRAYFTLGARGGVKCAVIDTYDPTLTMREGRIISSVTRCF